MVRSRFGTAAAVRILLFILFCAPVVVRAQDTTVAGVVVDQFGQPLPRAHVRAVDAASREQGSAFTDQAGRFRLNIPARDCRVTASSTGFEPATLPCNAQPLRIVLGVAPVRETVVVTATRTETPAGQSGASVTAFTAEDLERRSTPLVADLLRAPAPRGTSRRSSCAVARATTTKCCSTAFRSTSRAARSTSAT
jgi:outer membrane receptor protein involved in Fe transport